MWTLEAKNGKAYLVNVGFDLDQPRMFHSYFPINLDPCFIPENFHPSQLQEMGNAYIFYNGYRQFSFHVISENGWAEFTEYTSLPKRRGYIWKEGEWVKQYNSRKG